MDDEKRAVSHPLLLVFVVAASLCFGLKVEGGCSRSPVIFNMGDSNSDTGSVLNGFGFVRPPPFGRLFHRYVGRVSDGRLIIDFLCENLTTSYLTPYLKSMEPNFTNGANFAVGGAKTFPRFDFFNLGLQSVQFFWFQNQSIELTSRGLKGFVKEEDFGNALYMVDVGQNDLALAFGNSSYAQVVDRIPTFISEIEFAIGSLYQHGGRKFWVHNTGPLGCLPQQLVNISRSSHDFDEYGCLKSRNNAAKLFNKQLKVLCKKLRAAMMDSTVVYVDIFAIKYDLVANARLYGFENPLTVCCGHGGAPYNFDNMIQCGGVGYSVCEEGSQYVSWDGIHYTEAANRFVASRILSTHFCENLTMNYLTPYLESLGPKFTNGANFAVSGSATLPRYKNINLGVQSRQFVRFQTGSIELTSKGLKGFLGEDDFKKALYMIDTGQNDLARLFSDLPLPQVIQKIPTLIDEIKFSLWIIYQHGGRKFWVHNSGPFGCLPQQLGTPNKTSGDRDQYGCLHSRNDGAGEFNKQLKALCEELRNEMKDATVVYVDIFTIKYDLIANSTLHGFQNPLTACCGHGAKPYNFDPDVVFGVPGFSVCEEGLKYVSWDGVHYTEAANAFVASKILSVDYSTPPLKFDFFCNA